ncbi:MAG: hypothetical protein M0Z46_02285 [Actinomycetota bacterium]|nr:hypothetical protein [Actinomycetota bacterium]
MSVSTPVLTERPALARRAISPAHGQVPWREAPVVTSGFHQPALGMFDLDTKRVAKLAATHRWHLPTRAR